MKESGPERVRH